MVGLACKSVLSTSLSSRGRSFKSAMHRVFHAASSMHVLRQGVNPARCVLPFGQIKGTCVILQMCQISKCGGRKRLAVTL